MCRSSPRSWLQYLERKLGFFPQRGSKDHAGEDMCLSEGRAQGCPLAAETIFSDGLSRCTSLFRLVVVVFGQL